MNIVSWPENAIALFYRSTWFYKVYDYFTESKIDNSVANFSIISQTVVKEMRKLREQNRSYPLFVNWLGFKRTNVDIEHSKREEGKSSYTLTKLINLAIDVCNAVNNKVFQIVGNPEPWGNN